MIGTIRHKGLLLLYRDGDSRGVMPIQAERIARILARLDVATGPSDMDLPGYRLHPLKGRWSGYWSVAVSGNWRITFRFEDSRPTDVDLVDYH